MSNITNFIVLADAHQAKIYQKIGDKNFKLFLINTLEAELDSNHEKPTRVHDSVGNHRHGVEPHTDRREVERQKFAKKIASFLEDHNKKGEVESLIILASHQIISDLENALGNGLKEKIIRKEAKDIVKLVDHEVREYLEKRL